MPRTGKDNERTERIPPRNRKLSKFEPLHQQVENLDEKYNNLAKFPSENPYPVLRIHKNGTLLYANKASEPLLKAKEAAAGLPAPLEWQQPANNALSSGQVMKYEITLNERVFAFMVVPITENDYVNFYGTDITEQKMAEEEREITIKLLSLINSKNQTHDLMKLVTALLRDWSGCEAVGIRLQNGEDFPYFETNGLPEEFVKAESKLCSLNELGEPIRDSRGKVFLECMCGNIISGRFDPAKPFFTEHGSFWTNSTTALLANTTNADRMTKTRNRCNTAGYESVSLVPLRTGKETFGLLQFNSRQKNKFTTEKIKLFERLADNFAIGMAQRKTEESLLESKERYHSLFESSLEGIGLAKGNQVIDANPALLEIFGYDNLEEFKKIPLLEHVAPESRSSIEERQRKLQQGEPVSNRFEYRIVRKDGQTRDLEISVKHIGIANDTYAISTFHDITKHKQAEKTLRENNAKYRLIVDTANEGIWILDTNNKTTFVNDRMARIIGFQDESMIGRLVEDFMFEEDRPDHLKKMENHRRGIAENYERRFRHKDGQTLWTLASGTPIFDDEHNFKGSFAMFTDITERKLAQEQMQDERNLLRTLIDHIPDGIYIKNKEGRILDYNKSLAEIWKARGRDDVIGKTDLDLFEPELAQDYLGEERKIMQTGQPIINKEAACTDSAGKPNFILVTKVPLHDSTDNITGLVGIHRDITKLKLADTTLRQSEAILKESQHVAQLGHYIFDAVSGKFTCSAALDEVFGIDAAYPKTIDGWLNLLHPEQKDEMRDYLMVHVLKDGQPFDKDYRIIRQDNKAVRWVHGMGKLETNAAGQPVRMFGTIQDITERKLAENKILEYQKRLKQLASKLTLIEEKERRRIAGELHDEVSQTLTMAKIKLDTLRNSPPSEMSAAKIEEISSFIEKVIQETRTLTFELSNPILYELGFEAAVAEWLEDNIQKKHGIAIEFYDDELPKPLDDDLKAMLFRNVRELLTNCIKHARADKISVGLRRIDDSIEVTVEDNGVGFDPAQVWTKTGKKVTYGLFSIRENMENTGGSFKIESKPGAGCKATMAAPLTNQSYKKEV